MRFLPVATALSLALLSLSGAGYSQKPDGQVNPRSAELQKQGEAALAAGNLVAANDALETALAVDPRNQGAYVALGKVSQAQQMPGKAIRYYKDALLLQPNDVIALSGEGDALVQRGAVQRAKDNLARIQTLCKGPCPQATTLAAAIAKGPPAPVQTAQATDKVPPKGQEQSSTTPVKN